jgi:uncharacterized protein YndB with AHSA1/START domain
MAVSNANVSSAAKAERELVIERIFDAPPEIVFQAWTEPARLARWWGPKGFTNPICEVDLRVGGGWRIVMRAPDGAEYPGGGVYREIVKHERLVFTNIAMDKEGKPIIDGFTTVTFAEHSGKTKLTLQTRAVALAACAARMLEGMEAGWTQSLERLGEELATAGSDRELVFTRVFDAPRELVFEAWTQPRRLEQWYGPRGFTTTVYEMDVRPGGIWRLVMRGPDGVDYKNRLVFIEVVKPERLVYKHDPEPGCEPANHHVTVTFADQGGKTALTMRMLFPSAAELDYVVKKYRAIEGGHQTLDRLAEQLIRLSAG